MDRAEKQWGGKVGQFAYPICRCVGLVVCLIGLGCAWHRPCSDPLPSMSGQEGSPIQETVPGPRDNSACDLFIPAYAKNEIGHPWYGNYLGPGNLGYDKLPIDALDAAARVHDLAYDACGVEGFRGTITCLKVAKADLRLAGAALAAFPVVSFKGKLVGAVTAMTFGPIGLTKETIEVVIDAVEFLGHCWGTLLKQNGVSRSEKALLEQRDAGKSIPSSSTRLQDGGG
jgi:hypothetical protein